MRLINPLIFLFILHAKALPNETFTAQLTRVFTTL